MVTLTGVGGVGKTRLALQVAAEVLPRFREGAWLVELAPVRDPAGVVDTFAAVFGVTARAGQTLEEALVEFLRHEAVVVGGRQLRAPPRSGRPTWSRWWNVRVRVWSCWRRAVRAWRSTVSERAGAVAGSPDDDRRPRGGRGSRRRCSCSWSGPSAVDPEFALDAATNAAAVVQVCRRSDGVPLAIELAAAQVTMMSPAELARALDRRFDVLAGGRRGR